MPVPEPGFNQFVTYPVANLTLDFENPRFEIGLEQKKENEIEAIRTLCAISDVKELITSISDNGYLPMEPLIVCGPRSDGKFTVLEGNRRLSAIKILRDPSLAKEVGVQVPSMDTEKLKSTEAVPVIRVKSPEEARAFIGFKHINGPQRWDAYAKAKFSAKWYKDFRSSGRNLDDVARQLGDNNDTIRSYVGSIYVLEQAEREGVFSINDRANKGKFAFSHLYTALDRPEFREFVGLSLGWNEMPQEDPIPKTHIKKLQEMLVYVFGSKRDDRPALVRSQNPDVKQLGHVLANEYSLMKLRSGSELKAAFADTLETSDAIEQALVTASSGMTKAIELLSKLESESVSPSMVKLAREVKAQATIIDGFIESKKPRA